MTRLLAGFILALVLAGQTANASGPKLERTVHRLATAQQRLDRQARYIKRLERAVHAQATRAERNERKLARLRRVVARRVERGDVMLGLRCIQGFEGSWRDPDPPFWGGMQADLSFQRTYAGPLLAHLGTADNWPPIAQLAMGVIAYYSGRGFGPWPATRRMCGV